MIKIPIFPSYLRSQQLMRILENKKEDLFKSMNKSIQSLRGTPQEPVDWSSPADWIPNRLSGTDQEIARLIWEESSNTVNPRYVRGIDFLIRGYELITAQDGRFAITEKGKRFISSQENDVTRDIDQDEGCMFILYLCSIHPNSMRQVILGGWIDYLNKHSNYRSESVQKSSLRNRLGNLIERGLVCRTGLLYSITPAGEKYLAANGNEQTATSINEEKELALKAQSFRRKQKELLKKRLYQLSPYEFEHLVKELLEAMNYEDVRVTPCSHDKGVDVVATVQHGITTLKEVIQVKKNTHNIQRKVLDELRGCLHRFDAFQGTIITLSDFSKGTKEASLERNASPITLINGDKLLDLLIENGLAVKKKTIEYFTVDNDYFVESEETMD